MLTDANIVSLSITDRVILSKYLDLVKQKIQDNLRTMNISGYGPSLASGRSHDDWDVKETYNGAQLWGLEYLFELEYPLTPSQQQSRPYSNQWAAIREWVDEKPIFMEGDISADQLAGLITRSIRTHGTKAYQKYGSDSTGLVSSAITDADIDDLMEEIGSERLQSVTEFIMQDFYA